MKKILLLLFGVLSSTSILAVDYCEINVKNMNGCGKEVWGTLIFTDCTQGTMKATAWSDMFLAKKNTQFTLTLDTVRFTVDSVRLGETKLMRVNGIYSATVPDSDMEYLEIYAHNNATYNPCIVCDQPDLVKITDAKGNEVKLNTEALVDNFVAPGTYYVDSTDPEYTLNYAVVYNDQYTTNYSLPDSIKLVSNDRLDIVTNYVHRQPSLQLRNGYGVSYAFDGLMKQFDYTYDGEKGSVTDITELPGSVDAGRKMTLTLDEEKYQVDSVLYMDEDIRFARKIAGVNGVYTTVATDGTCAYWIIYPKMKPQGTNKVVFMTTPKDLDTSNLIDEISIPGGGQMSWWPKDTLVALNGYKMSFRLKANAYRIDSVMVNGEKNDGFYYEYQTTVMPENTPTIVNIAAKAYPKAVLHTNNVNAIRVKSVTTGEVYVRTQSSILYIQNFESDTIAISPVSRKLNIEVRQNGNAVAVDTAGIYRVIVHEGDSVSVIYTPSFSKKMKGTYTDYSAELPNYKNESYGMVEGAEFDIDVWDNDSIIIRKWMNDEDCNLYVKFGGDSITTYTDGAGNVNNFVFARNDMMVQIELSKEESRVNLEDVFFTFYQDMTHQGDTCYYHLTLSDVATGINTVAAESQNSKVSQSSQRYTLQGMRAKNNYKGIVIQNGKMFINR